VPLHLIPIMHEIRTVAILISTYNWPQALELVLKSLVKQTKLPDEVVIADDGSGDDTAIIIAKYNALNLFTIKHVWHEDLGFRKSLIVNKAVKAITADYIIEIDGDIITDSNFIKDHLNAARPGHFVQGSRAMITEKKAQEILSTKEITFSVFSSGLYSRFNAIRLPILTDIFLLDPSNPFHIKGCNLAFWRKDFIAVNGYNNDFKGWGGEDYEFGARLLHSGIKRVRLKMAALAFHIFHPDNSRANTKLNDLIYRATLKEKLKYSSNGYKES
jgi:glycosyltransferase involved in cell wall biosynthesis